MTDDRLPSSELQRALDHALAGVALGDLRAAATSVSASYRAQRVASHGVRPMPQSLTALAYAASRMPATLAATRRVLQELRDRSPELRVTTLLDLGSGPGTTLWAASSECPDLDRAILVEPDPSMVDVARRLLADSSLQRRVEIQWHAQVDDLAAIDESADLVVVGYLLTELPEDARRALVRRAWQSCSGAIAVIVPGSTDGFRAMLDARAQLLSLGATVVAPCPHAEACPLPDGDWCHFGVRLNRSSLHRRLKGGALPYEDEKYGYVVATRRMGTPADARVIRRPRKGDRRVTLRLCRVDGLRVETIAHGDRTAYKRARKVAWGSTWERESRRR